MITRRMVVLVVLVLMVLASAPWFGYLALSFSDVFGATSDDALGRKIFWELRVPRVLVAAAVGAALSVSGLVFQVLFRNVLATPFTLGVSSGAALGAALYYQLGLAVSVFGIAGGSLAALLGGLVVIGLITVASTQGRLDPSSASVLLLGIVASFFCSSAILLIQYIADFDAIFRITRWLMGGFEGVTWPAVYFLLPAVILGVAIITWCSPALEVLRLGDELAASRGVAVARVRQVLLLTVAVMVGVVVAVAGPIGFIGILIPEAARAFIGGDVRRLVPVTVLLGALFLVVTDTIARMLVAPYEIPVGVITALIGAPFLGWVVLRKR